MAIYWTYDPAPKALWNTAHIDIGSIPTPRTLLTEQEWKDALALQNSGYELVDGPSHKPIGQLPVVDINVQRQYMIVERYYFHNACRATAYSGTTLWDTLKARLPSLTTQEQEQYADIFVFRRLAPYITTYFKDAGGINLTDTEIDTLFNDAIALANS